MYLKDLLFHTRSWTFKLALGNLHWTHLPTQQNEKSFLWHLQRFPSTPCRLAWPMLLLPWQVKTLSLLWLSPPLSPYWLYRQSKDSVLYIQEVPGSNPYCFQNPYWKLSRLLSHVLTQWTVEWKLGERNCSLSLHPSVDPKCLLWNCSRKRREWHWIWAITMVSIYLDLLSLVIVVKLEIYGAVHYDSFDSLHPPAEIF